MKDIERCRRDWFAEDLEETSPGLNAVAAPVLGPNSRPLGYIVVLGLASAEAARQYGPLVAAAGKTLSRQLGAEIELREQYGGEQKRKSQGLKLLRRTPNGFSYLIRCSMFIFSY